MKQYNLVPARAVTRCGWEGNQGLTSHWPCVPDLVVYPATGSWPKERRWTPWIHSWREYDMTHFTFIIIQTSFSPSTLPSATKHPSYGDYVEVKEGILSEQLCAGLCDTVFTVHTAHTYVSSSYRSNRLGLSHWDPYTVRRRGCLEFWWDSSLISTTNWFPSVLWHCWFGHLACKNRLWNDI